MRKLAYRSMMIIVIIRRMLSTSSNCRISRVAIVIAFVVFCVTAFVIELIILRWKRKLKESKCGKTFELVVSL